MTKRAGSNIVIDFIRFLLRTFYACLVDIVANFVANVLEHPRVQGAAAETLVRGMIMTMEQPDLPRRAAKLYLQLQEDTDVSRQLGEQFPKVAANFIAGAASSIKRSASFYSLKRQSSSSSIASNNDKTEQQSQQPEDDQAPALEDKDNECKERNADHDTSREETVIQQLSLGWRNNKAFKRVESLASIASIESIN